MVLMPLLLPGGSGCSATVSFGGCCRRCGSRYLLPALDDRTRRGSDDVQQLRTELYAAAGLTGQADSIWQDFIVGGEVYRDHLGAHDYPSDADRCLYCQQPLDPTATALLRRYRDFANDTAQARITDAIQAADATSRELRGLSLPSLLQALLAQQDGEDLGVRAIASSEVRVGLRQHSASTRCSIAECAHRTSGDACRKSQKK